MRHAGPTRMPEPTPAPGCSQSELSPNEAGNPAHMLERALAETAGADVLMEKPLDVPLLLQAVRELMDEPMESRARRARNRASGSRCMPPDNQPFDETLLKCCMTPAPLPESKDT